MGKPYDIEDQVEFVIDGLPKEYKTVADQIESTDTTPTLTMIHERLLNHEAKLQAPTLQQSVIPISATTTSSSPTGTTTTPTGMAIGNTKTAKDPTHTNLVHTLEDVNSMAYKDTVQGDALKTKVNHQATPVIR